jgi:DNA-binding transcriptional LysR family regulator
MYTLDQLRGFVAVAEEGTFGRAAHRLAMTQPPLSRQVQKLERAIGVVLFDRTPRAAVLTPAGRAFLVEARRLLAMADAAPQLVRRVARGTEGAVRLGFTAVGALNVLGRWVRSVQGELPGVDLVLTEMVTSDQLDALLAGEIDVGLLRGRPRNDVLVASLVHRESLVLAAPRGHPLTTLQRGPTLAEVAEHDVVTYAPAEARYFYELVVSAFVGARVHPRFTQYLGQAHSILALVDAGLGVALVPESLSALRMAGVDFLRLPELDAQVVELYAAWRRDHDAPALREVLRIVLPGDPALTDVALDAPVTCS